jgi:hypothetical protein
VFASLGSLLFGYDLGVISQVIAPTGNVMLEWNPNTSDVYAKLFSSIHPKKH